MCKVYIATGINDSNREGHEKLYKAMAEVLSKEYNHRDGLGYAAVDKDGNLFGERWLVNADAFKVRNPLTERDKTLVNKFLNFLDKKETYNSFGNVNLENITSITLHTRLATSGKEFSNTHPFVEGDTSVIHNGMINNHASFRKSSSTCDSEAILTQYIDLGVAQDITKAVDLSKALSGYYACALYSRDKDGKRILDVMKSSTAALIGGYIKELDSVVFTSLLSHLEEGCKMAGLTLETNYEVTALSMLRLDPITGEALGTQKLETYSYTSSWNNREYEDWYSRPVGVGSHGYDYKKNTCNTSTKTKANNVVNMNKKKNSKTPKWVNDSEPTN